MGPSAFMGFWTKGDTMKVEQVNAVVTPLIRKYDWSTFQLGYGVRLTVTDGLKKASVDILGGEDIEAEAMRLIEAVDKHEYGHLEE